MLLYVYVMQIASRYSTEVESEVIGWFKQLLNEDIEPGMHKVEKALHNGQALVKCVTHFSVSTSRPGGKTDRQTDILTAAHLECATGG